MATVEQGMPGTETESQFPPAGQNRGSGRGCLWGCLAVVLFVVGVFVCGGVGMYFFVSNQVTKYTSDTPVDLPTVEYDEETLAELETRVESFQETVDRGETPKEDLVLSADDINALIGKNEDMRGKVFVKIEDGLVKGDVSIPTDFFPGGKGRFFNGSATFDVSMEDGVLIVVADEASVNGEPLPGPVMEGIRSENLAKDLYKDPENAKFMRRFRDIQIDGDKVILKFKRTEPEAGSADDGETASETDATSAVQTNPLTQPEENDTVQQTTESESTE